MAVKFANRDDAQAFADNLVLEADGLPKGDLSPETMASLIANEAKIGKDVATLATFLAWSAKRELWVKAEARAEVNSRDIVVRPSRTGNAISFYRGNKHAISPAIGTVQMVLANLDAVKTLMEGKAMFYYQRTPGYKYRGKEQPAKPAVVVAMQDGEPKIVAKDDNADAFAKAQGLEPVNTVTETEDDE